MGGAESFTAKNIYSYPAYGIKPTIQREHTQAIIEEIENYETGRKRPVSLFDDPKKDLLKFMHELAILANNL